MAIKLGKTAKRYYLDDTESGGNTLPQKIHKSSKPKLGGTLELQLEEAKRKEEIRIEKCNETKLINKLKKEG